MLKSTHKAQSVPADFTPLPPGWTEHKAPTGHSYFYNAATEQSTYTRPSAPQHQSPQNFDPNYPPSGFGPFLSNSAAQTVSRPSSNALTFGNHHDNGQYGYRGRGSHRPGHGRQQHSRHQPEDRPKTKHAIPGCSPWFLVKTKLGRRFVYNPEQDLSLWKFPPEVMKGVVEYDRLEREKKEALEKGKAVDAVDEAAIEAEEVAAAAADSASVQPFVAPGANRTLQEVDSDGYGYEEIEVTDDEGDDENDGSQAKRQKIEGHQQEQPVEFDEEDIAYQLAAMGQDYGLDPGEYGNADSDGLEEGAEGLPLSEDDSKALFKDLLDDLGINPYSTWDNIIEEGRIIEDDRYTVLPNMKTRKEVWGEWGREKAQKLKEQREKQEKKDPRIPYLAFLQKNASPKLYWPEFKRKYKKEPEMRDSKLADKDREKLYRDHINRLKLPHSTLKSDLSALLKSAPLFTLNRSTIPTDLPATILTDIRYISLDPTTRDPLIEAYISTLPPPPSQTELSPEEEEQAALKRQEREKRDRALQEREDRVREEKRRQKGALQYGRGVLKEGEMEIERALRVDKSGLKSQLGVGETEVD
ncbi:MAG: hypothetical protein M1835_004942 [Candelina submexicana]|nr:MAG: hypothetical protein M1835_004942 [Candelina submexicana]